MLSQLQFQNYVLFDKLQVDLQSGLTAITGESGAGKSLLLQGLDFILGARVDWQLFKAIDTPMTFSAQFDVAKTHKVCGLLQEQGIDTSDGLILRRVFVESGKAKAFINDVAVSQSLLQQVGSMLVSSIGQFASLSWLQPEKLLTCIDGMHGNTELLHTVADNFAAKQLAAKHVKGLEKKYADFQQQQAWLAQSVQELSELAPQKLEETELLAKRKTLIEAQKDLKAVADLAKTLDHGQFASKLWQAGHQVEDIEALSDAAANFQTAGDKLDDGLAALQKFVSSTYIDDAAIDVVSDRLEALRDMARKLHTTPDGLCDMAEKLSQQFAGGKQLEKDLLEAKQQLQDKTDAYNKAADDLSAVRKQAAKTLVGGICQMLPKLGLDQAKFDLSHESAAPSAGGIDSFTPLFASGQDLPLEPLTKVASGGEMGRLMLSLAIAQGAANPVGTFICDEIDAGLSGEAASLMAQTLSDHGDVVQVITITHSPQVAAKADQQFLLKKHSQPKTHSTLGLLNETARIDHIAHMLAGKNKNDKAKAVAASLLGALDHAA